MKKVCQDYLAPKAVLERSVLLALGILALLDFVGRQVTQGWMVLQDKQVCQALRVRVSPSALTLKAAISQVTKQLLLFL